MERSGVINIYKEAGYTSHDVVAKLRGILKQKKIGHTGTLDPQAQGVLPVYTAHPRTQRTCIHSHVSFPPVSFYFSVSESRHFLLGFHKTRLFLIH